MIEEALRRARIPAYFSRGRRGRIRVDGRFWRCCCVRRRNVRHRDSPNICRSAKCRQRPVIEMQGWVPAGDELLPGVDEESDESDDSALNDIDETQVVRAPAAWEKLLVDAAVIGGRDRWQRRLRGLEREFELRLTMLERDDESRREYVARKLEQLRQLERSRFR